MTKQSAARTIAVLLERGYVEVESAPADGRRKRLGVTQRGFDMLREGETIFDELRERWAGQIGTDRLAELEAHLTILVGDDPVRLDAPGWIATEQLGAPTAPDPLARATRRGRQRSGATSAPFGLPAQP